jgi:hypothetical protein
LLVVGAAGVAQAQRDQHEGPSPGSEEHQNRAPPPPQQQPRAEPQHQAPAQPQHPQPGPARQEQPAQPKAPPESRPAQQPHVQGPTEPGRAAPQPKAPPEPRRAAPQTQTPREPRRAAPQAQAQAPQESRPPAPQQASPQGARAQGGREVGAPQGQHQAIWQQHRARNWQSEHRDWAARGGYSGYRIPDARFRGSFGLEHGFLLASFPLVMAGAYPRFQYNGFWFSVLDPWPEYWAADWYGTDDVYIDYAGDGYYLYNRSYPGDRIALSVQLN